MDTRKNRTGTHHTVAPAQVHTRSRAAATSGATQQAIAASKTHVSPGRVRMQTGEVKLLSFWKYFSRVWTSTQYLVPAFRSGKVTRLALLLMFRTCED